MRATLLHYVHHGLVGAALFAAGWWMRACHDYHHL